MSDRLPRRGDWMGYEGAYVCGIGWLPLDEAKEWLRDAISKEARATTKASVVVNQKKKHDENPKSHRSMGELEP